MKKNDLLIILIPSLLIVILWVIFSVYHSFVTSTIPTNLNYSIQFISPDFDSKAIENIKARQIVDPLFNLGGENIIQQEENAPEASESANASSSALLEQ